MRKAGNTNGSGGKGASPKGYEEDSCCSYKGTANKKSKGGKKSKGY